MKFSYIPAQKNNKTKKLVISLFFLGLILFIIGGLKAIIFKSIIQAISIIPFVLAIMLASRYLIKVHAYRIEDEGEGLELFVDEITRNSAYTVCRLELKKLLSVTPLKEYSKEDKKKRRYDYRGDLFEKNAYILEFLDGTYDASPEKIRIILSYNEEMLKILECVLEENKQFKEG